MPNRKNNTCIINTTLLKKQLGVTEWTFAREHLDFRKELIKDVNEKIEAYKKSL